MEESRKKSAFPAIHVAWIGFFIACLFCLYVLMSWSDDSPLTTLLKINNTKLSARIKNVIENEDGSVDVLLRLDQKLQKGNMILRNFGRNKVSKRSPSTKPPQNERQILTKTNYPLTLSSPYVINNPDVCLGAHDLTFLVIVHSAPNHFQRRRTLRETWANKNVFKNLQMRIVFLFGLASDERTQVLIENESTVYKDIVQGNFKDTYRNLTHKGVLGYRWISEHCNISKLVIKVDDDVFVNVFKVIDHYLPVFKMKPKQIFCHLRKDGTSPILHGNTKLKWAVDEDEFRHQKFYPTYCNGYAVFMTPDIITGMYRAAYLTPFFWVDDVYLFGLLPKKVGGVQWQNVVGNFTLNQKIGLEDYEGEKPSKYVVCTAWQDGVMERLWFAALSKMTESNRRLVNDEFLKAVDQMVSKKKELAEQKSKSAQVGKKVAPQVPVNGNQKTL